MFKFLYIKHYNCMNQNMKNSKISLATPSHTTHSLIHMRTHTPTQTHAHTHTVTHTRTLHT